MPDHLRALREKYERMRHLRVLHERGRADPSFAEPDPRAAMAELARAFPGALREIDELTLAEVEGRIAAIAEAEGDEGAVAPWMTAHLAFHRLARGALAAKRWLHKRTPTPDVVAAFRSERPDEESAEWAAELDAIAAPPRGRLLELVHARLARELGVTEEEARRLVFPSRRSGRRAR